jgi:hypothetical protein
LALHLVLVPEYFNEKPYIGALFAAGGVAALGVTAALWRARNLAAGALGAVIALGMAAGFVLSQTVGLPGCHPHDWEASGLLSLGLEGASLAAWAASNTQPRSLSRA